MRERERRRRDGAPPEVVLSVEHELVLLSTDWLQLELQSGHSEQALACLQAQVEFACFAPAFPGAVLLHMHACEYALAWAVERIHVHDRGSASDTRCSQTS